MGWGDEIMVTGEVRRLAGKTKRRFAIWDSRKNEQRWNDIWWGNPRIALPGEPYDERLINHGGARPYIESRTVRGWKWKAYAPTPGEIFLADNEAALAEIGRGMVVIKVGIKDGASPNKMWSVERWQALVDDFPKVPWFQIGTADSPQLRRVPFLMTRTFREACGVLSGAKAVVLLEGGLHHAAAAFGVPGVVIFGGYIGPRCTGYSIHKNLFHETEQHPLGCGMRVPCLHCQHAMENISPKTVYRALEAFL